MSCNNLPGILRNVVPIILQNNFSGYDGVEKVLSILDEETDNEVFLI